LHAPERGNRGIVGVGNQTCCDHRSSLRGETSAVVLSAQVDAKDGVSPKKPNVLTSRTPFSAHDFVFMCFVRCCLWLAACTHRSPLGRPSRAVLRF
jgi:hypothetical protein